MARCRSPRSAARSTPASPATKAPDPTLQRTLAEAHAWARALRAGTTLAKIAATTRRYEPYICSRLPLAFLAPRVQTAILDGMQPVDISITTLIRTGIASDWQAQAKIFGLS